MNARDRRAIANGHPSVAEKVVCVDFDGTLHPWVGMFDYPEPFEGAARFMQRLEAEGYRIVIFTSRMSNAWHRSEGRDVTLGKKLQRAYIVDWTKRHGIPWHDITAEKIPAIVYIDDKALTFDGAWAETEYDFFGGLG